MEHLDWMVIGAGPAGIAAVGKLLDHGVAPKKIGWLDPDFSVGDLGKKWNRVPSNTKVDLFLRFLHACPSFELKKRPKKFHLEELNPQENCLLQDAVEPLQWITGHLSPKVHSIQDMAMALRLAERRWEIKMKNGSVYAKNVILAIGSDPKTLPHTGPETIPLETALHDEKLAKALHAQDTVAIFGSSHSAILVLANVLKHPVKKVINFYRSPHKYAVYLEDWILFDDSGLKGFTAKWAKENLDGIPPANLSRVLTSNHTFEESLSLCNKAIYATGFDRRKLPILEQFEKMHYDETTGIIAPGLFGVGIAFPEVKFDRLGHLQQRVGLWKFMDYLNQIMPIWHKYSN